MEELVNHNNFYDFVRDLVSFCDTLGYGNSIFVLDNVRFHHSTDIKAFIEEKNHELLFLPAYTPIFNPIENMFSQWKNIVRRRNCRTESELFDAINDFQNIITEEECLNYYNHCLDVCYSYIAPT